MGLINAFACVFVIVTVSVIHTTLACSSADVQACISPLMDIAEHGNTPGHHEDEYTNLCLVVKKAMDCMKVEIATCPPKMKPIIDSAMEAIKVVSDACKDPSSIDPDAVANCSRVDINECAKHLQVMSDNEEENCLKVGRTQQCMTVIKKTCKSKYMDKLIASQETSLKYTIKQCHRKGYMTVSAASTSDNGSSAVSYQRQLLVPLLLGVVVYQYVM